MRDELLNKNRDKNKNDDEFVRPIWKRLKSKV